MTVKHEICNMQTLVIAATESEIAPFMKLDTGVDTLITGVGLPATLYHLQKRINQIDYNCIVQAGIAGTFNRQLQPGQTVLVKQDVFGDLGMEEKENFTPVFETDFGNRNEYPFENGWLINKSDILQTAGLPVVNAVTVNKVSDSELQIQQLKTQFGADIETMEGAALHYICLQENIPFIQMRSISNEVGERDRLKWKIKGAIDNLNAELIKLVQQLMNK